jgi:hypothetical protein
MRQGLLEIIMALIVLVIGVGQAERLAERAILPAYLHGSDHIFDPVRAEHVPLGQRRGGRHALAEVGARLREPRK